MPGIVKSNLNVLMITTALHLSCWRESSSQGQLAYLASKSWVIRRWDQWVGNSHRCHMGEVMPYILHDVLITIFTQDRTRRHSCWACPQSEGGFEAFHVLRRMTQAANAGFHGSLNRITHKRSFLTDWYLIWILCFSGYENSRHNSEWLMNSKTSRLVANAYP